MGLLNIGLVIAGVALVAFGWSRVRGPWRRYQALREQDANIARYESWRGGLRDAGETGASVAMQVLRRQARNGAFVIVAGFVALIAGFGLPPLP
jgi:hypothetical protein